MPKYLLVWSDTFGVRHAQFFTIGEGDRVIEYSEALVRSDIIDKIEIYQYSVDRGYFRITRSLL